MRYLIRRLRRVMPNARFLAGFWMLVGKDEKAEEWRAAVGADLVATTLSEARDICMREAQANVRPAELVAITPHAHAEGHAVKSQAEAEPER